MKATAFILAAALAAGALGPAASAGSTTGFGAARVAYLADAANGVEASVAAPETMSGIVGYTYRFHFVGSASTSATTYSLAAIVSPGSDTEARWNGSAAVPAGAADTSADVVIPPEALPFTAANTPFAIEVRAPNGTLVDRVEFSVDLRYREPPPDGGLLALALASASVWGVVFLYALNLHFTQRKLRAKAEALERAVEGPSAGVRADGKQR